MLRRFLLGGIVALASVVSASPASAISLPVPTIKHVWVITLENESADTTFGAESPATFFNKTLKPLGAFVPNYYGTGHASLDNYISMISGQGPNPATQGDCPYFVNVMPGTLGPNGQAAGVGCVYPKSVLTLADQLEAKGLTWKGYMQDMGNDLTREAATCAHPTIGSPDRTEAATTTDSYATRHNPFMYFHSIIDEPSCQKNVVSLTPLLTDLQHAATTPAFSFITPSLCEDGHDAPCADGRPGGLISADLFLATWAPRILASPAFAEGGMLIVNFDESEANDATACCGEMPNPGGSPVPGLSGPGGGRTGAVVVSSATRPGTLTDVAYNHYSLLRSVEDLFGVGHLGFAAAEGLTPFGPDIYNASAEPHVLGGNGAPVLDTVAVLPTTEQLPETGGRDAATPLALLAAALVVSCFARGVRR